MIDAPPPIPKAALIRSAVWFLGDEAQREGGELVYSRPTGVTRTKKGYAVYLTIRFNGYPAFRVKVCENKRAQVKGFTNISLGQLDCAINPNVAA